MCIFIDECSEGRNDARRSRHWAKKGKNAFTSEPFHGDADVRYTFIRASDINGFIREACEVVQRERNRNDNDPNRETIDTKGFIRYIKERIVPILGNYDKGEPRSIVFLDTATVHHYE